MAKKRKGLFWLSLLLIIGVLGAGYYLYVQKTHHAETEGVGGGASQPNAGSGPEMPTPAGNKETVSASEKTADPRANTNSEEYACADLQTHMTDFFLYLDEKRYVQHLELDTDTFTRFGQILQHLSDNPPIPAGEGIDPRIIVRNVYHLFRTLDRKDLRLIREVIMNEEPSMEVILKVFYTWAVLRRDCPVMEDIRPSMETLYLYAGFFINTTGGRSYLFRRSPTFRLVLFHYCISIVHEADKMEKNSYGIDILPFIVPLIKEIAHYSNLEFQKEYLAKLRQMENYYLKKR